MARSSARRGRRVLGTTLLIGAALAQASCGRTSPRPNLLLITVDTLRADHLGVYGYPRGTSPNIDRLASRSTVFDNAYAQIPKTNPSLVSLMTGLYPQGHKNLHLQLNLPQSYETLAEILEAAGYRTAGIVGQYNLHRSSGIGQGFGTYLDEFPSLEPQVREGGKFDGFSEKRAGPLVDQALVWLEQASDGPFFLWVHFMDPHAAYDPPPPYDEALAGEPFPAEHLARAKIHKQAYHEPHTDLAYYLQRYDGEIRYLDHQIGRLLEGLSRLAPPDSGRGTMIVFTADHGEYLGDRDGLEAPYFSHGITLTDGETRVPLIWRLPAGISGAAGGNRVSPLVQLVDFVPTVADVLGLDVDSDGRSLRPCLTGGTVRPGSVLTYSYESNSAALQNENWKLVFYPRPELASFFRGEIGFRPFIRGGRTALYERVHRGAALDVSAEHPDLVGDMKASLLARIRDTTQLRSSSRYPVCRQLDNPELEERLKSLGYL